ncbi:MAG: hypothetical protein ACTSU7_01000 [Candidatus Heimdallarchaeaceae archaeon]
MDIDKSGNIMLQDNSIVLLPKMFEVYKHKHMGSPMIRFIVSMYDYKSPYRNLPEERRLDRVKYNIWKDKPSGLIKHDLVKEASEEYMNLQYDPDIEAYKVMMEKAHEINKVLKGMKITEDNIEDVNILQEKMAKASKSRQDMLEIIKKTKDSDRKIFGQSGSGNKFSLIEQQKRQKGE